MALTDRPLVLNPRVRFFRSEERDYAHVSHVPLTYLSLAAPLRSALDRFRQPTPISAVAADGPDRDFFGLLHRTGVLLDAQAPDPIHKYRGAVDVTCSLYLYPTNSCNLRCVYCYATSGPGAGPRLSREHALMAVDDFFATLDDGIRGVTLRFHGGGEPTTNFGVMVESWQRFRELAEYRGLRASVSTISNGTFGPAVLRTLTAPEWGVLVSYDGPLQSVQRPTAAQADSRDRVVANLRALRDAGKFVSTRATVTADGLPRLLEVVEDAAEVGVHQLQVEPASVVGRGGNLDDGPPDPLAFAEAYLAAFERGLDVGVQVTTAAWSSTRVGDGRFCGAIQGARALTPDGFVSACTEACDGAKPDDPFIVGRLDTIGAKLEIWPVKEASLAQRTGANLPTCHSCYMVDTCAGGCASRALAQSGDHLVRDEGHCIVSRYINPRMIAALAEHRLVPDAGWQPMSATTSSTLGTSSMVAIVPPFALARWNASPERRPFMVPPRGAPRFFHRAAASPYSSIASATHASVART